MQHRSLFDPPHPPPPPRSPFPRFIPSARHGSFPTVGPFRSALLRLTVVCLALLVMASGARAQTTASAESWAMTSDLTIAPLLGSATESSYGPTPIAAGTAPPVLDRERVQADASVSLPLLGKILSTEALRASVGSNLPGEDNVSGLARVDGASLGLPEILPVFRLTANSISARADIAGDCRTGILPDLDATLEGATLTLLGAEIPLPVDPAPNSVLLDQLGIRVIANEQVVAGSLEQGFFGSVNALRVRFDGLALAGIGLLSGEIVIAHAEADLLCDEAPEADLSLAPPGVAPSLAVGDRATLRFRLESTGPDAAEAVALRLDLPRGLDPVSTTSTGGGSCSSGNPVVCTYGRLGPGQGAVVDATVEAAQAGSFQLVGTVASSTPDPDPADNRFDLPIQIDSGNDGSGDANLVVELSGVPGQLPPGDQTVLTVRLENLGPGVATAARLETETPGRLRLIDAEASSGDCGSGPSIRCLLGDIAPGTSRTVTLVFEGVVPGLVAGTIEARCAVSDPDPTDNAVFYTFTVTGGPSDGGGNGGGDGGGGDGGAGGGAGDGAPIQSVAPGCRLAVSPAASLLVPSFEVALDDPAGATTLVGITNVSDQPRYAQVTLWTDWGIPTLSFPLWLAGRDVATLNLRDLLAGRLPKLPGPAAAGCPATALPTDLAADRRDEIQAWHSGRPSPLDGRCAGSPAAGDGRAVGFVTVDVLTTCSERDPTDPGYFAAGGTGVASNDNILVGDVFWVVPDQNAAQGEAAVHLVADADLYGVDGASFYSAFTGGADQRQPLGDRWATRFLSGGAFSGGTELMVWRDVWSAAPSPVACGTAPASVGVTDGGVLVFDEQANVARLAPSNQRFPLAINRVSVDSPRLPVGPEFGWMILDLSVGTGRDSGQAYVVPRHTALGRYSLALPAFQLVGGCPPIGR